MSDRASSACYDAHGHNAVATPYKDKTPVTTQCLKAWCRHGGLVVTVSARLYAGHVEGFVAAYRDRPLRHPATQRGLLRQKRGT